ncbi:glycoside hydrolase family 19 protein [Bartonella sp. HY038]|uniref:glycoside hydrolase family 19 protein n=1 Tax=Bartonella sp. HY038 TaxID=2759660 RepID=UPI0015FAA837|nr:glycoside hydrolase family 19 protein [Bartonella sp. HY038]
MKLTAKMLRQIAGARAKEHNIQSVIDAYNRYGTRYGLDLPHRLAQFLAQILHESDGLFYNQEIWGPTKAQHRYDIRTDLGNTPTRDGDGKKYKGWGLIQITGKANITAFYNWCLNEKMSPPNFIEQPEQIAKAPWSALCAFWYWNTNRINRYADRGDIEMVTKCINGGLNGYADRLQWYDKASLVLLGFDTIKDFQKTANIMVDGISGPRTRAEMHKALVKLSDKAALPKIITDAPVVEVKIPKQLDKPLHKTAPFWERITSIAGLAGISGASWLGDWRVITALAAALIFVSIFGLIFQDRITKAIRSMKAQM